MDDGIGQFLHFMSVEKGASDNTIDAYRNDLVQFKTFLTTLHLNGSQTDPRLLTHDAILGFLVDL